ncbi:hypothetical protein LIER_32113 [Lithospermum erythrorhizon]|uniref:Uncharacterized protein n=1 Tax=Lithospermum erythrorhizon TaxID=34254 RepID=A0AAV3RVD7_LITER
MDSSHYVKENSCFGDDGDDGYWSSSDFLDEDQICSMDNEVAWYVGVGPQDEQLDQNKIRYKTKINTILELRGTLGNLITKEAEIKDDCRNYFMDLFTPASNNQDEVFESLLYITNTLTSPIN